MTDDEALLDVAPELTAVDATRRQNRIEFLRPQVRSGLGQYGLALAVAHALTLAMRIEAAGGSSPAAGPIISEKEGELSRTYANNAGAGAAGTTPAHWASTHYGQMYWDLVRSQTFGPRTRMG